MWYLKWKVFALAKKLLTKIFCFWTFTTSLSRLKLEVSYPHKSGFLFNLDLLALWLIFLPFFTYSESPLNSVLDKGLTYQNYSMEIELMSVWKKLLANARIGSSRGRHHHPSKQASKHLNPTIILHKIMFFISRSSYTRILKSIAGV